MIELIGFPVVDGSEGAADEMVLTDVVHDSVNYPTVSTGSGRGHGIEAWIDRDR